MDSSPALTEYFMVRTADRGFPKDHEEAYGVIVGRDAVVSGPYRLFLTRHILSAGHMDIQAHCEQREISFRVKSKGLYSFQVQELATHQVLMTWDLGYRRRGDSLNLNFPDVPRSLKEMG